MNSITHRNSKVFELLLKFLKSHTHYPPTPFQFQCAYALALYNEVFRYMAHEPIIIKWNSSTETFSTSSKTCPSYWLWYFNVFIVAGVIGFGSCASVVANAKENDAPIVIAAMGFGMMAALLLCESAVFIAKIDGIVDGITCMKKLRQKLGFYFIGKNKYTTGQQFHSPTYWNNISIGLQLSVVVFAFIPPLLVPAGIYVKVDPFAYVFPKILPASISNNSIILIALRIIASMICTIEACRFYSILLPFTAYWLELLLSSLEILNQIPYGRSHHVSFLKWYSTLQISVQTIEKTLNMILGVMMGTGFIIFVGSNIGTVRAYNILPLIVYWLLPTVSLLCIFFIFLLLSLAAESHTLTFRITKRRIRECKLSFGYGKNNLFKVPLTKEIRSIMKRYDAVKPLGISCAGLYPMKRGSDVTFFYLAFLRSVDGMLLPFFIQTS